jgi:hypothetical protein
VRSQRTQEQSTDKTCPVCRLIEGLDEGKGSICEDCKANQYLQASYEGYKLMSSVRSTILFFVWGWPVLLVGFMVVDIWKLNIISMSGLIVPWLIWAFNVFWLLPHMKITRIPWKPCERLEKERHKMFVLKVRG